MQGGGGGGGGGGVSTKSNIARASVSHVATINTIYTLCGYGFSYHYLPWWSV